jgi:RNA polymerase sigma factor (sigma-70 family)
MSDTVTIKDTTMRLLTDYQNGIDTANEIIRLNMPFITYVTYRAKPTSMEFDDAFQEASIGMYKAIKSFDLSKEYQFSTYASRVMANELWMAARKEPRRARIGKLLSLDSEIKSTDDGSPRLIDFIVAPDRGLSYPEITEMVADITSCMNERDQSVIYSYVRGYSQHEIARHEGISQSYISRIINRFKALIHSQMAVVS